MPYKNPEDERARQAQRRERYRDAIRTYHRDWQRTHKTQVAGYQKTAYGKLRATRWAWLDKYKTWIGCCRCGDGTPLEFHHRDPVTKSFNVGRNFHTSPWRAVLAEVEKCDVLCTACHREIREEVPF